MSHTLLQHIPSGARSVIASLVLLTGLLPVASIGVAPAAADNGTTSLESFDDSLDPDARLEIIVKSIKVLDDHDWGEGEIAMKMYFWRVRQDCSSDANSAECTTALANSAPITFDANEGDTVPIRRAIPDTHAGAWFGDPSISPTLGIPVFSNQSYGLAIEGVEEDTIINDDMGTFILSLTADSKWDLGPGHASPAARTGENSCHWFPPACPFRAVDAGSYIGDFEVDYEIAQLPLPDLTPTLEVINGDAGQRFYCARVINSGMLPAAGFQLQVYGDGALMRSVAMSELPVGASTSHCVMRTEFSPSSHSLAFRIDEGRQIAEMDEHNNLLIVGINASSAVTSPSSPQPLPAQQAELLVSSMLVNGKPVGGQLDCIQGKNEISVTIKNTGARQADPTVVQIRVDGGHAIEQTVPALDGGSTMDVSFDNVRLKKGSHNLTATADAKHAITESTEDNNALTENAVCKDDDN